MQVAEITVSYKPNLNNKAIIKTAKDAFEILKDFFNPETIHLQEEFWVLYLNRSNRVLGVHKLSIGGITGTIVDIRIVLGTALKAAACSLILAHSHPSGNPNPSQADIDITRKIKEAASLMDIKLLDHLIISPNSEFTSMAEDGLA